MNRRTAIITFILSLFSFISTSRASTMSNSKLENTQARFALKLFGDLLTNLPPSNLVVSPSSVYLALSLLFNGAKESTQNEMAKLLKLGDEISLERLNQDNLALQTFLSNPDNQVTLSIANSLWVRTGVYIYPSFIDSLKYFYKAEIANLDFNNPNSVIVINEWVNKKTNNKIPKIIDELSPDQVLLLINAIYFKGIWAKQFDKKLTQNKPFYRLNGGVKDVPLMSRQGEYLYLENNLLQVVSLPYSNSRLSLDIFLPKENNNFSAFLEQFDLEKWQEWTSQLRKRTGTVEIPRFKLEYQITLNTVLERLGMKKAFQAERANFSGLTNMPVYVNRVLHKTYLEVNEEGTEAAAVTSIGVRATSAMEPREPFIFKGDRPFICILRERETGSLLFMGTIVDPTS